MKKIGFIGAYDKTDIILSISKVLAKANKKVLILDNTITQKCKYVVPVINPTKSYITNYEDLDVAVGFENMEQLRQYIGLEDDEKMEYDYFFVDTDSYVGFLNFGLQSADKNFFVTSFDMYSLKKGTEILTQLGVPVHMTRIFYSKEMLKEEVDYFEYLVLGTKAIFDEEKIYFLLENGDLTSIMENQRISKIKLSNLSREYSENIEYLTSNIAPDISGKTIRSIIKEL